MDELHPCTTCVEIGLADGVRPRAIDAVATTSLLEDLISVGRLREVGGDVPVGDMLDLACSELKYTIVSFLECQECGRRIFWGLCIRGEPILRYAAPGEMEGRYWFDVDPLLQQHKPDRPTYASLRTGLGRGASVRERLSALKQVELGGLVKEAFAVSADPIEAFALANGLDYRHYLRPTAYLHRSDDPVMFRPGLLFRKYGGRECNDFVSWAGPPYVEFANVSAGTVEAGDAAGWGWVGIRHGLDLPHVVLDARANDAGKPDRRGRVVTSLTEHARGSKAALETVQAPLTAVSLGGGSDERFQAWVETAREKEAVDLLIGPLRSVAEESARTFDVELVEGWTFLYGYALNVSTTDPDRWAWLFSLASRWLDVIMPRMSTADRALEPAPFYTRETRQRPASVTVVRPDAGFNALANESYWWSV